MPSILIVDDDPAVRHRISEALHHKGFQIHGVAHGAAALAWVHRYRPDLIILDLIMPVMDGWETMDRLRDEGRDDVPVVVLTASRMLPRIQRQFPASPILSKPLDMDELVTTIQRVLGTGQAGRRR